MPIDAYRLFYRCQGPRHAAPADAGDYCVFHTYGDLLCPPKRAGLAPG